MAERRELWGPALPPVRVRVRSGPSGPDRAAGDDMDGWWCVRYGDALACVEAPSAAAALRRSLDLNRLGDWTDDARELVVFPQDAYPDHAGPHDYTRAVLNAEPPPLERRRARPRGSGSSLAISCLAAVVALGLVAGVSAETWRGLTVAPEHRCASYDKKRDYPYPQSVEQDIVRELGAVYGPYTGTCFASTKETDIEHIVAASEAHDSGLCARDAATRARFTTDRRNLTLRLTSGESPGEERQGRRGVGPGPEIAAGSQRGCSRCAEPTGSPSIDAKRQPSIESSLPARAPRSSPWYARSRLPQRVRPIALPSPVTMHSRGTTTIETGGLPARRHAGHGIAPVPRSHPAYLYMRDGDADGVVCE